MPELININCAIEAWDRSLLRLRLDVLFHFLELSEIVSLGMWGKLDFLDPDFISYRFMITEKSKLYNLPDMSHSCRPRPSSMFTSSQKERIVAQHATSYDVIIQINSWYGKWCQCIRIRMARCRDRACLERFVSGLYLR